MSERAVPVPTPETQFYWDKAAEGELWLPRCDRGHVFFHPRTVCPVCGSTDIGWVRSAGRGTVESFVINHTPAPGYQDQTPYAIAYVRLDEGPRLTTNLLGIEQSPAAIHIGLAVEVTFERRGPVSLPQFRPVASGAPGESS